MPEQQQTLTIQQAIDLGVQHHTAGRLPQAETIYQQILQSSPKQPIALHLLGVIAHQVGKNDTAVDLITKALALKPDYAEAYSNLGLALQDLGKLDEAVASFHKALTIQPDYAEAHYNLGIALQGLGKLDEAVASYNKALAIKPDYAEAHSNLGVALQKLGKLDEAVASFHKVIAIKPDAALAHNNLGNALQELGQRHEAVTYHRRAVAFDPQNDLLWAGLAESVKYFSFTSVDDNLLQDLWNLLEQSTVDPYYLSQPIISALRHHPDFSRIVELTGSGKPEIGFNYGDVAEQLSAIPLFLRMLELNPIYDLEIERMLTFLRHAMIEEVAASKMKEKCLPFSVALALQCFTNEYVFSETEEEKEAVEKLEQRIALLAKKGHPVPPSFVVALGTYRPLFSFPWAQKLSERKWTDNIKSVITRQITEPLEERYLRDQIPCITPIQNTISKSVREQYEENPYPRWIKTDLAYKNRTLASILRESPLRFDLGDYVSPEHPEILVAGCGTGQHSLFTASRFSNARVLAVDLSLSSLSYALRKTNEFGFSNIEYAQADITELGGLGRQFDLIECSGVLHHLGDPLAGWHVLVDLLRPGGSHENRPI